MPANSRWDLIQGLKVLNDDSSFIIPTILCILFCKQEEAGKAIFKPLQQKRPLKCLEVLITARVGSWA
jgi:hypothetical protein